MVAPARRPRPSSRPAAGLVVIVVDYGARQPRRLTITRSRRARDALFDFVHPAPSLS
jgi:hypothetical protein